MKAVTIIQRMPQYVTLPAWRGMNSHCSQLARYSARVISQIVLGPNANARFCIPYHNDNGVAAA